MRFLSLRSPPNCTCQATVGTDWRLVLGLRFPRRFRLARTVEGDRLANERPEGGLVNFFSFVDVDRAAYVSVETRVEETGRILQRRALGEGKLYDILVGFASADDAVVRPNRSAHPLPLLDDVRVGFLDELAHSAEGFPAPVPEFGDSFRDELRCRLALARTRLFHVLILERGSAVARGSAVPAGDGGRLLDPGRQLLLVDLVRLAHIQGAHVLELADGRNWLERGSLEEAELDVVLEGCEGEEPAVPLDSVKWAVPPHGFADAGHVLHDERVDALGDGGLPRLHAGDVDLHAGVPIGLGQRRGFAGLSGQAFPGARGVGRLRLRRGRLLGGQLRGLGRLRGGNDGAGEPRPAHGSLASRSTSFPPIIFQP